MPWASVKAALTVGYDSVIVFVRTAVATELLPADDRENPVLSDTVTEGVAALRLVFIVAVKSPAVGAFVRFVTVVIVPAVIFVGLETLDGNVTPAAAVTV